jgi:hypothetical protein
MTIGQSSLSNRLLPPSSRRHLSRPRGIYEKKPWRDAQADDETLTLSSSGSEQSNRSAPASAPMAVSCTSPAILATNVSDAYKKLHYQCEKEIIEVKYTLTQPLEEIVESVMGLFTSDGFQQMSHAEHVAELGQKAAWMGQVRVGPQKQRMVLTSRDITVVNENSVTTSNEGPGRKDHKEAYECVCESSDHSRGVSSKEGSVKIDNDSPAQDPHARGKVLVKARWINNYHKYNQVRKKEQLGNAHIKKTSPKRLGMAVPNNEIITDQKGARRQKRHVKADALRPSSCSEWSDKMVRRPGKYGERSGARRAVPTKGKPARLEKQGEQTVEHDKSDKPLLLSPSLTEEITKKLQNILTNFQSFHP